MQNQQIYEEASEWFVRMRDGEGDPSVRNGLLEWLRRSPEHVSAYLDIAAVWMEARNVEVDSKLDLATRIAAAKADRSVAELTPRAGRPVARFLNDRKGFALVASVLLMIAGLFTAWWKFEASTYSTELGEQRSIALQDGSTINLNSESRVRIHFDDRQRTIELLSGQALFNVAKNPARPFIVRADDTSVRAVGTVFEVYRKHTSAVVTVVEGVVDIQRGERAGAALNPESDATADASAQLSSARGPARVQAVSLRLTAGKQVVISPEAVAKPKPVNITTATAWTRRELVFEFTPLAEVAEEFNRYNERQLIVEGDELRSFKISAIFQSTDSASFVRYMRSMSGVRIQENERTVVISAEGR